MSLQGGPKVIPCRIITIAEIVLKFNMNPKPLYFLCLECKRSRCVLLYQ